MSKILSKLFKHHKNFNPTIATIEVTEECNGSCEYCFIKNNTNHQKNSSLSKDQLLFAIDRLATSSITTIVLTGGEPFIRDDILDILSYLIKNDFFKIHIKTNGTLITNSHYDFIMKYKHYFGSFEFSVFSHISKIHDAYMGIPDSLEKIVQTAQKLRSIGLTVRFSLNLVKENLEHYWETKTVLEKYCDTIRLSVLKLIPNKKTYDAVKNIISVDEYLQFLQQFPHCSSCVPVDKTPHQLSTNNSNCIDLCHGRFQGIMVDSMGNIHPCTAFRNFIISNIINDHRPLREILQSCDEYLEILQKTKDQINDCKACQYFNFCTPCLGAMHTQHGNYDTANESLCNYAKAFDIYLHTQQALEIEDQSIFKV